MGIVQGAVLSMLLFSIYFTPFSAACKNISPTINGEKFNPQCYVDDGTAIAVSVTHYGHKFKQMEHFVGIIVLVAGHERAVPGKILCGPCMMECAYVAYPVM